MGLGKYGDTKNGNSKLLNIFKADSNFHWVSPSEDNLTVD
jgi:hypothetical protein